MQKRNKLLLRSKYIFTRACNEVTKEDRRRTLVVPFDPTVAGYRVLFLNAFRTCRRRSTRLRSDLLKMKYRISTICRYIGNLSYVTRNYIKHGDKTRHDNTKPT